MYVTTEIAKKVTTNVKSAIKSNEETVWKPYRKEFFTPYHHGLDCIESLSQSITTPIAYCLAAITNAIVALVAPLICGFHLLQAGYRATKPESQQITSKYLVRAGVALANTLIFALQAVNFLTLTILAGPAYAVRSLARTVATGVAAIDRIKAPELRHACVVEDDLMPTEAPPLPTAPAFP